MNSWHDPICALRRLALRQRRVAGAPPAAQAASGLSAVTLFQLLWLLVWVPPATGQVRPPVVASINVCADQLVMLLADAEQIASLSFLAQDPAASYAYEQARWYPVNEGLSEQILPLAPDVVIAGPYTAPHTLSLLRELGLRVEILPIAESVEAMLDNLRRVGRWLGQSVRSERWVEALQARLRVLDTPAQQRPVAAVYDPNGYTVGTGTLRGQIIELAGWQNAATLAGIRNYGTLPLETLVRLRPDALIESPFSPDTYSRAQALTRHPALGRSGINPLIILIASRMTICAGPWTIDVIEQLQAERHRWAAAKS